MVRGTALLGMRPPLLSFQGTLWLKIIAVYFKVNVVLFLEKNHASECLKKRKLNFNLLFLELYSS